MLRLSVKLTDKDMAALCYIIKHDPLVERGPSEAIRLCYETASSDIPDWNTVCARERAHDFSEDDCWLSATTTTFIVPRLTYDAVYDSVCQQLEFRKPRISSVTRLCIYSNYFKLHDENCFVPVFTESHYSDYELEMVWSYVNLRRMRHPRLEEIDALIKTALEE